jgi:hypothetical protein
MQEGFRRVLQITITKRNLAAWSQSVSQRLQEGMFLRLDFAWKVKFELA